MKTSALTIDKWIDLSKNGLSLPITFLVDGDSMWPLIRRNRDQVTAIPLSRMPRVGDIVLFKSHSDPGTLVVHRIWKVKGTQVRTYGDGRLSPDIWMPVQDVLGIITKIQREKKEIYPSNLFWRLFGRIWLLLALPKQCTSKLLHSLLNYTK